jgi:PAS domain S-box-containing protein
MESLQRRLTILIVDDEPVNIQVVSELLSKDYNLSVARSGLEALQTVQRKRPDIILLDVIMPEMDGFETAKKIFEDPKNKDIPIIFFSVDSTFDYVEKGFEVGAVDYIAKPIDPKTFLLKIGLWAKLVRKTKQTKIQQQLLDQYKNTVDRSAIVSKADKNGIITYVNDKFCEISGYTQEELLGHEHNIVRHPDVPENVFEDLWKTIRAKKPWFGKMKNKKKNGTAYYTEMIINPIVGSSGDVIEYIAIHYDITKLEEYKRLLEDRLANTSKSLESNINYIKQYENAIDSITAVVRTDTENIVTNANTKFCELLGYSLEELVGRDCKTLRDEKHQKSRDCAMIKERLQRGEVVNMILANIAKDGKKLYMDTLFYPILDLDKQISEYLQVMHNVTPIVELNEEIIETQKEVVFTMGEIGERRSQETGLHVKRVAEYSYLLAKLAGLEDEHANLIKQASPMHDIGKIGIPDAILNKPAKLTPKEYEVMKTHAQLGYEMLKHSKREILKTAATIAHTHHERFDGSGYPRRLAGTNIPIEGRITAIADVFDALGHDRVYKKAWEMNAITALFEEQRGKHFDPRLIDLFFTNLDKFLEIKETFTEEV